MSPRLIKKKTTETLAKRLKRDNQLSVPLKEGMPKGYGIVDGDLLVSLFTPPPLKMLADDHGDFILDRPAARALIDKDGVTGYDLCGLLISKVYSNDKS